MSFKVQRDAHRDNYIFTHSLQIPYIKPSIPNPEPKLKGRIGYDPLHPECIYVADGFKWNKICGGDSDCCCTCETQVLNVLTQMLADPVNFGGSVTVYQESGSNNIGAFGNQNLTSLVTGTGSTSPGVLVLGTNSPQTIRSVVPICRIAAIVLNGETDSFVTQQGTLKLNLLPVPDPLPATCAADCESALRTFLSNTITPLIIKVGNNIAFNNYVAVAVGYGMVFFANTNNPTVSQLAVSLCKLEMLQDFPGSG
jgi:hypothetical protein